MSASESTHPYVCTECGREVRMAAEIVPDNWDSYQNKGVVFACRCTKASRNGMDKPHYWVLDTDYEVGRSIDE